MSPSRLIAPALALLSGTVAFAGTHALLTDDPEVPGPAVGAAAPIGNERPVHLGPPARHQSIKADFAVNLHPDPPTERPAWRPWQEDPGVLVCPVQPE